MDGFTDHVSRPKVLGNLCLLVETAIRAVNTLAVIIIHVNVHVHVLLIYKPLFFCKFPNVTKFCKSSQFQGGHEFNSSRIKLRRH